MSISFLRLLAFSTNKGFFSLSVSVILQVMAYSCSILEVELLADLVDLILRNKLDLAKKLVKLHKKACLTRQNTDRFSLSR